MVRLRAANCRLKPLESKSFSMPSGSQRVPWRSSRNVLARALSRHGIGHPSEGASSMNSTGKLASYESV